MKKVLIVDDSKFMRKLLKRLVEKGDYQIIAEASNGQEAIEKLQEFSPDITLLDITLPCMSGLEILKKIKEQDPSSKVVICSSLSYESLVDESEGLGANGFIVKPYFDKLLSTLDQISS
ncbi:hypothetical protein BC6307_18050 [Sutcliffiella cohnii]|uniref:Response regulatory domain-containing protein n=1 Tax=Sutcliffiella cohnii TaxID=33932 RepID=A0A223KUM7_9BACI|nr:response regulator [Sutcliffiella cohnii]AST93023.1 hypothetical protein BC6307_18050 [Sutcliffiella cohnii]